jgi:hypothetical protein
VIARRRLRSLVALAAVLALVAVPASASAFPSFHKRHVTYRDRSGYTWQVLAAIKWINDSPARIVLQPARRGKRADIEISRASHKATWDGLTRFVRRGNGWRVRIQLNAYYLDDPSYYPVDWMKAEVATHELGHALGLPHRKGCSIMIAGWPAPSCRVVVGDPVNIRCGLFRVDAIALIRRYGGKISTYDAYRCPPVTAPAA